MPKTLEELVKTRRSIRAFLHDKPVTQADIRHALEAARFSSSNLNTQPWRLVFLSGAARDRVSAKLQAAWDSNTPLTIAAIPEPYKHYQQAWGETFFGDTLGFPREDTTERHKWFLHNFNFFKAPVAAIVMMDDEFHYEDALAVGIFIDAFGLLLKEQGIDSCLQVSIAGYPDLLREELGIGKNMKIICGMAIGYPDPEHKANTFKAKKEPVEKFARFVDE
jgi:nitroreductase